MPRPVPELTDHIGYWLRQVSNHVSHAFAAKLAAKDVTVAEWVLMRLLYEQSPTHPSSVADAMGFTRGGITKLADRLVAKGCILRDADPEDGRAQTLKLTAKGTRLVPELAALADRNEVECFTHLSTQERRTLQQILKKTVAALGLQAAPVD